MKKIFGLIFISLIVILTACGETANNQPSQSKDGAANDSQELEPITIRLGHVGSEQSGYHAGAVFFRDLVSEKTDGKVTIDIYSGGVLGGDRDLAENISNGSLSMGKLTLGVLSNFTPVFSGLSMPFLVKNLEVEYELYNSDFFQVEAAKELEKLNIKPLGYATTGFYQFGTTSKPLRNINDLNNVTIRASETEMIVEAYHALGLNPTPMPFSDMYSAIETGVIDAGALQSSSWVSEQFTEVIDYVTILNAGIAPSVFVMNLDEFNQLPEEYQTAIEEAGKESVDYLFQYMTNVNDEAVEVMKGMDNLTVIEDFDYTGMEEKLQPVIDKFSEREPFVKQTFELIEEINKKFETSN